MKSEHRHHLAENDLEHRLAELAEKLKPYAKHILFGALAISAAAIAAVVWFRSADAADSQAWAEFAACQNANQYIEVAEAHPDSSVAQWANVTAGEILLRDGVEQTFSDRSVALDNLEKAKNAFNDVLNNSSASLDVRERALNGLARTLEAMSNGEVEPAIEAYERFIQEFPESRHKRWAEDRIAALQSASSQEFYAWFDRRNPSPADRPTPGDFGGSSAVDPHAGLEGLSPFLDPSMRLPGSDLGPGGLTAPETGEEMETTEGEPIQEGAAPETGESTEGPSLGPTTPEGEGTETPEPADPNAPAPTEGEATETPAEPETSPDTETAPGDETTTPETTEEPATEASETEAPAEGENP